MLTNTNTNFKIKIIKNFFAGLVFSFCLTGNTAGSPPASCNPKAHNFKKLPNGSSLDDIKVKGCPLCLSYGTGVVFGKNQSLTYQKIKRGSQASGAYPIQWALMDLDSGRIIKNSKNPQRRFFGASSSKIFVAAGLLNHQKGKISKKQLQQMANMIVVSNNGDWISLQKQVGDGDADLGRKRIHAFTQKMGYKKTHGFQGYLNDLHGNELTAQESVEFLHDTYKANYPGAEYVWKIMQTTKTGSSRARKYLPKTVVVGGKTGTYSGMTEDSDLNRKVRVNARNHLITFSNKGRQYALAILADTTVDEFVAILAGGLYRELDRI